jgi:hypothetical protein
MLIIENISQLFLDAKSKPSSTAYLEDDVHLLIIKEDIEFRVKIKELGTEGINNHEFF